MDEFNETTKRTGYLSFLEDLRPVTDFNFG